MQQTVDAAEVDECTKIGDILDDALANLILGELLHQLFALARSFRLENHAARNHDVAAALVELDDLELVGVAEQLVDVGYATKGNLRAREECIYSHEIDYYAALDLLDEGSFDGLITFVGNADAFPDAHEVGLLLGEDDGAFLVFEVLEQNFDFIADGEFRHVLELFERDGAFRLEADVEYDEIFANFEYTGLDDLAFFDGGECSVVHLHHCFVLFRREFVFFVEFRAPVGQRTELRLLFIALFASCQLGWHIAIQVDIKVRIEVCIVFRFELVCVGHAVVSLRNRGTALAAPRSG